MSRARTCASLATIGALLCCADPTPSGGADAGGAAAGRCPDQPCSAGTFCYQGICLADQGPCKDDDGCINDTFCSEGRCVPYGPGTRTHDERCSGFAAERFVAPTVRCNWSERPVVSTPLVVDLDGDGTTELVFIAQQPDGEGALVAVRGIDCGELFDRSVGLESWSHPAAADLTGDGRVEIVAIGDRGHLLVFDHRGQQLAKSAQPMLAPPAQAGWTRQSAVAIAELDGQAPPEIIAAGMVARFASGQLSILYRVPVTGGARRAGASSVMTVAVDIDGDQKSELIAGNRILDGATGKDRTPAAMRSWPAGFPAVADFDADGEPEVVLISSRDLKPAELRVFEPLDGALLHGPLSFGQMGGPPTVADFDGDGAPEVGFAAEDGYRVFDPQCDVDAPPPFCHERGVRWFQPIAPPFSSPRARTVTGMTGSSVFDFNGDGRAEVIYGDHCWLRVYDGLDGTVRFAHFATSWIIHEMPVVADVDGDGHAELVVPSSDIYKELAGWTPDGCPDEPTLGLVAPSTATQGVFVLQDPKDRWASSRPLWNQHAYHVDNIADDRTIPPLPAKSWKTHNTFRQNVQGQAGRISELPDLTGAPVSRIEPRQRLRCALAADRSGMQPRRQAGACRPGRHLL